MPTTFTSPSPRRPMEPGLRQAIVQKNLDWVRADTTPRTCTTPDGDTLAVLEVLDRMTGVDDQGHTPWLLAALYGRTELLNLLEPWSALDACNDQGRNALMLAAGEGHLGTVIALLERPEARPDLQDLNGGTALMHAAAESHDAVVERLLPVSNPRHASHRGETALLLATKGGHVGCVERLIPVSDVLRPCGITWNPATETDPWPFDLSDRIARKDQPGHQTPLMWATTNSKVDLLDLLIPVSNHTARDSVGRTAFELACSQKRWPNADRLAFHADPKVVASMFETLSEMGLSHLMPMWTAKEEQKVLRATLALLERPVGDHRPSPDSTLNAEGPDTPIIPETRSRPRL